MEVGEKCLKVTVSDKSLCSHIFAHCHGSHVCGW